MTAKDLFAKDATVEYRVVPTLDGTAQWHWVLFNVMGKVLAGNTALSRGKASAQARRKARQLHHHIRGVKVTGLVEEGRPIDIRKFISSASDWMDKASKLGYKPTQDQFWAKASEGEVIYAYTIEGFNYNYTISIFGGISRAKSGGRLVWIAIDFQDVHNKNRIPLHTFLTTDQNMGYLLGQFEMIIETHGESWGEVDRILGNMRQAQGVIEALNSGVPERLPANPTKDYIMGTPGWQERLVLLTHGWGARSHMKDDPEMRRSANYQFLWGFEKVYMDMVVTVFFEKEGNQVPRSVILSGEYSEPYWHNVEQYNVSGDTGMNEFVDHLEPVVKQVNEWHNQRTPPSHWEFAKLVSRLQVWMTNQQQLAPYI